MKLVTLCAVRWGALRMILFRKASLFSVVLFLLGALEPPQAMASNDPPEAKQVDALFAALTKPGSPGCALAVARNGIIIYEKGYGLANVEEEVTITPRTVFDIGSTSKQFTASSILLLEREGKLSVNDDVRKYIPELPDYSKKITILNLLNHTSGIRDYLTLFELSGVYTDSVTTDEDALAIIARQKSLNFDPGSEFLYSNSGYFLLSVIVKRASGKTLPEFAAENIFKPLEMNRTLYRDQHTQLVPGRALAYDPKEPGPGFTFDVSYFEQTGDGAVHTSVEDLLKWDENFYTAKVGGKAFLAELQETARLNNGKQLKYAKGLVVFDYRGLRAVEHGGSWGGYRAQLLRFPDQHFSVACLCNLANADPESHANRVAEIFLASEMKPPKPATDENRENHPKKETVSVSPDILAQYEGEFVSEELFVTYILKIENGKLALHKIQNGLGRGFLQSTHHWELRPVGKEEFVQDEEGINFAFSRDSTGKVSGFVLAVGRSSGIAFSRKN
ncbi:MAG TPA: serine hydrolase domain-containing protein [Candidatus Dormibacteraeota bacterium]|jgi:CubicO group peptidase (beta-lactamase class C family)|nr:serine hydrolase domain-containing protein [Candidatus Dormibacteraeota bacterium]